MNNAFGTLSGGDVPLKAASMGRSSVAGCVIAPVCPISDTLTKALTAEMCGRGEVQKSGSTSASWMGVPLRTPTRTVGVLMLQHYEEENVYDERDLEFLSSVGSQLALAIERKRAEQALQESEERYHRLVELSPDAIIIHQEGRFVFVNSAAVRLTGARDESQLIGKSIFDIVSPEFREMLKQRAAKMYQGELSRPTEIRGRRFDGVEVDCELDSVPYQLHDRFAVLAVLRDISERKRAEQALREANERARRDADGRLPDDRDTQHSRDPARH